MDDRTLLERAAKAAGLTSAKWDEEHGFMTIDDPDKAPCRRSGDRVLWMPIDDNDAALRLAVRLGMQVCINRDPAGYTATAFVQSPFGAWPVAVEQAEDDDGLEHATRRAITRAAAMAEDET